MQRKYQPVRVMSFLTLVGVLASCTDAPENIAGPDNTPRQLQAFQVQTQSSVHLSGQISTSVWQAQAEGFAYLGTVSSPVEGTLGSENVTSNLVGPARITFPETARGPAGINMPSFTSSSGNELWNVLRASGPGSALRIKLGGPSITDTMPDGRELRVELSPASSGRPSRAMAFYVDNDLRALNLITHRWQRSRWTTAAMDVVHFDQRGGVAAITKHDLTEVEADPLALGEKAIGAATGGVQTLSVDCETQIIPDPECSEEACWGEWLRFTSATAAYWAASAAFGIALAACPETGVMCAGAVAAAIAMSEAAIAVDERSRELEDCRRRNSAGGGAGHPPGGGGQNCYTLIIEVSNDGGNTWTEIGRIRVCEQ